jgi:hypothetical protein
MRVAISSPGRLILALGLTGLGCAGGELSLPSESGPAAVKAISGGGQEATVGSRLREPLVVRVTDAADQPLANVPVLFRFQGEFPEAQIMPSLTRTDSLGRAAVEVLLGTTTGEQTVEATLAQDPGPRARALFGVTALEKRGRAEADDDAEKEEDKNKGKGHRG